ncbi:MAG: HAD family hydrolase [Thermodesulfovibrionales bacterium]
MILVFDLDDTLYEEMSFVESGFRAVTEFLAAIYKIPKNDLFELMMLNLENGRGKIFDELLTNYGIFSKKLVGACISVYRYHRPNIKLYQDAIDCIERFKSLPKYIVTDGNKIVQENKINALNLNNKIKRYFITHRFGIKNAKPSPYCFNLICKIEKVQPSEVVFIGDNPTKDFVGIKPIGFKTIRLLRGNFKVIRLDPSFEADFEINSFTELTDSFLENI